MCRLKKKLQGEEYEFDILYDQNQRSCFKLFKDGIFFRAKDPSSTGIL